MEELVCGCGKSQEIGDKQDSRSREQVQDKSLRRFVRVESGIYRDTRTGRFYERPTIDGKRTWRKLVGNHLGPSREEYYHRRAAVANGQDPYHKKGKPTEAKPANSKEEARTVGDVIRRYEKDGYPDKHLLSRPESTRASEGQHCHTLLPFWNSIELTAVTFPVCDDYRDWRLARVTKGEGLRAVDCELNTLSSAFRYSKRRGIVTMNPLADRPKYQPSSRVRHCREFMPTDADELHEIVRELFKDRRSQVLGWQMLAEGRATSKCPWPPRLRRLPIPPPCWPRPARWRNPARTPITRPPWSAPRAPTPPPSRSSSGSLATKKATSPNSTASWKTSNASARAIWRCSLSRRRQPPKRPPINAAGIPQFPPSRIATRSLRRSSGPTTATTDRARLLCCTGSSPLSPAPHAEACRSG